MAGLPVATLVVAVAVLLTSCIGSDSSAATGGTTDERKALTEHTSVIATATAGSIPIYREPGAAQAWLRLAHPTELGADRTFLVKGSNGSGWLRVLLPIRPNGSEGWVERSEVTLSATTYRVHVYLDAHRIVVKHGADDVVVEGPIGVGTQRTPTPGGEYYLVALLKPPERDGPYGPYAFGLSGFSSVLKSFSGGPGQLGLHGTNQPGNLGTDVSHGCIQVSNATITKLAEKLPLGTPVYIHA